MRNIFLLTLLMPVMLMGKEPIFVTRAIQSPQIDGVLNDSIWQASSRVSNFMTFIPDFERHPAYPTEAFMAYDEENLYFAFRCLDPEVNKIKSAVTSRDNIGQDDFVCVNLDSFNDHQSLYAFYVNPAGIQMDSRFSGGVEDPSVDVVWYSEAVVDSAGYTVEMMIPLKSIRYRNGDTTYMSVFLERKISRHSEHSCFPPMDPDKGYAFLTQMAPLAYSGLKKNVLLEILPDFTYGRFYQREPEGWDKYHDRGEFGLTAKLGITSDLVLDATYNPDFSQVESDAGQVDVNLRYALYYPEKRPFFLEGKENYNVSATMNTEVDPVITLVHTRNIINPLVGAKLSGKIGVRNTVSTLYAYDEREALGDFEGAPSPHFSVFRYKRTLKDDSYLGAIYTGRDEEEYHNRLGGIDGTVRINSSSSILFNALGTITNEHPDSLEKQAYSYSVVYNHDDRDVLYNFAVKDISTDFRADMGYVTRTGLWQATGMVRPHLYPQVGWIRRIDLEGFTAQSYDRFYSMWETFNHVSADNHLFGAIRLKLKYSYSTEIFLGQRFKTGGYHVLLSGTLNKRLTAGILYRNVNAVYYSEDPFQGRCHKLSSDMIYRPLDKLEFCFSYIFNKFYTPGLNESVYEYSIFRSRITFQFNRYLFLRVIGEYNAYHEQLMTDFLLSFTYIPGTVIHLGYGAIDCRADYIDGAYRPVDELNRMQQGLFFKASYLYRL